ncbi:invasion associated locus B family protein [Ciceribacter sp. RN22]|uniref:invasion associated locus B family protein n=1 Tax=Ciceribacter sp. RN22 TaxID=2954932 RepID=UPI0020923353|nr:invasion associated locus B family protein [Ciceribacter sp. RN22]MCO6180755.1 invasion associated locus B family protein [Ciceribacter sp. RN22]
MSVAVFGTTAPTAAATAETQEPGRADQAEQGVAAGIRSQRFDDWTLRCRDVRTPDGRPSSVCEVAQVARVELEQKQVTVLTLAISRNMHQPTDELLLTVLVPLNVFLPAGLDLHAGDRSIARLAYRNCNSSGCWAQQPLDASMVASLKKSNDGSLMLRLMNGQNVNVSFSLKGITAALAQLRNT